MNMEDFIISSCALKGNYHSHLNTIDLYKKLSENPFIVGLESDESLYSDFALALISLIRKGIFEAGSKLGEYTWNGVQIIEDYYNQNIRPSLDEEQISKLEKFSQSLSLI